MATDRNETQVNGNSTTGFVVPMGRKVRVWSETTVRVGMGEYDFIRYTFGSERLVTNNAEAIARAERAINSFNQEVITARITEYQQLVEELRERPAQ